MTRIRIERVLKKIVDIKRDYKPTQRLALNELEMWLNVVLEDGDGYY